MTRTRASFVRSAFTLLFGAFLAFAVPAAHAGTGNDAALVMDAETGRVLYARSADASRSPASLTKMMTLYMVFDLLKAGRLSMTDEMTASANAAAQKPTKLGLKKGDTITVEQAIYALAIVSANDVAVVVAEHIGGTEAKFAQMMTQRARDLGMKRSTFRNASGLPNDQQRTTARDMAVLSRALMRNHPGYYEAFKATAFTWKGKTIRTHNRVLLSLAGANGIKTGYTRASGFNLTTSAERDGKRLIGVVLGGDTWKERDEEMKTMLEAWFAQIKRRPALVATYGAGAGSSSVAAYEPPAPPPVAVAVVEKPAAVVETPRVVAMAPIPDDPEPAPRPARREARLETVAYNAPVPAAKPARLAARDDTRLAAIETGEGDASDEAPLRRTKGAEERVLPLSTLVDKNADEIATLIATGYEDEPQPKAARAGDWGIQIGAFDSRGAAQGELARARKLAAKALKGSDETVMQVTNDAGRTFYRARFVSFSNAEAQKACKALKAEGLKCVTFSTSTASAN
ncbi:MAG: SPOR domain-containing protein [Alphaproteobacteria bacterium]|nr:SPOR domain-containing protein [Alphaproteobacteria bacterium]